MQFFQKEDLDKLSKDLLDKTTNLYNKSALFFLMSNILVQYKRYEENWSFIIMDCSLDRVHSSCETLQKDQVDRSIADRLLTVCRKSDVIFYCSNSTFCILTRVFEGDDVVKFCEKLSGNLKDIRLGECVFDVNPKFGITFSKMKDTPEGFSLRSLEALKKALSSKEDIVVQA